MKPLLLTLLCSVACAQTITPTLQVASPGITVGTGLNISSQPRIEALTNELGIRFIGGPNDGHTITIGSVTSELNTNVVHEHNAPWVSERGSALTWRGTNMTEQWWITNIVETHTLKFLWRGKERTLTEDVIISSVTNHQILRSRWMPKERSTNTPTPPMPIGE